jgi:anti-sigma factor RsiW
VNCDQARELLDGFFDTELDLVRSLEVERHLEQCPDCSQALRQREMLRNSLRDPSLFHRAPEHLRQRVTAMVPPPRPMGRSWHLPAWPLAAVAASLALLVVGGWALWHSLSTPPAQNLLAQALVDSHVRSLLGSHLVDIAGPDRHIVKPWFSRQLEFSPPVVNLDKQDFTLEGARADYVDHRKVACIVYKRRQHVINLFVWPALPEAAAGETVSKQQGYNLIHWTKSGFSYWAISDLNEQELQTLARLIREQTE